MNKTVQNLKLEIESIKKTGSEGILERLNLRILTGSTEASFTNRREEMKENRRH